MYLTFIASYGIAEILCALAVSSASDTPPPFTFSSWLAPLSTCTTLRPWDATSPRSAPFHCCCCWPESEDKEQTKWYKKWIVKETVCCGCCVTCLNDWFSLVEKALACFGRSGIGVGARLLCHLGTRGHLLGGAVWLFPDFWSGKATQRCTQCNWSQIDGTTLEEAWSQGESTFESLV